MYVLGYLERWKGLFGKSPRIERKIVRRIKNYIIAPLSFFYSSWRLVPFGLFYLSYPFSFSF